MNFVLDENFPRSSIALLARFGYTGRSILEFLPQGTDDFEIFKITQREKFGLKAVLF